MAEKPKIVVTHDMEFTEEQKKQLEKIGELIIFDKDPENSDEWLKRCSDANIIVSRKSGLKEKIYELNNVLLVLPFVGVGWVDKEKIKEKKITISYCQGCNKSAVSEWIIAMILNLFRKIPQCTNSIDLSGFPKRTKGLMGRKICILGKGNVGVRVGEVCVALKMGVDYFERNDNLLEKINDADVIVNCLSNNESTKGLLDKQFFNSLKKESFFISVTSRAIYDYESMIDALNNESFEGAAIDAGGILSGDVKDLFYLKLKDHEKIIVTPHMAYRTDVALKVGNDMVIENIMAWVKKAPINLLK